MLNHESLDNEIHHKEQMFDSIDSKDFTDNDAVSQAKRQKKIKNITTIFTTILIILAVIIGGLYFFISSVQNNNSVNEEATITDSKIEEIEVDPMVGTVAKEKPLVKILQEKENFNIDSVKATAFHQVTFKDNTFKVDEKYELRGINDIKIKHNETGCTTNTLSDYCFAGTMNTKSKEYQVYFMSDMVHSRFFDNAKNVSTMDIPNTLISAHLTVQLIGSENKVLLLVNDDYSGFMIVLPDDSQESVNDLTSHINYIQ